jgi:hypothetical protein
MKPSSHLEDRIREAARPQGPVPPSLSLHSISEDRAHARIWRTVRRLSPSETGGEGSREALTTFARPQLPGTSGLSPGYGTSCGMTLVAVLPLARSAELRRHAAGCSVPASMAFVLGLASLLLGCWRRSGPSVRGIRAPRVDAQRDKAPPCTLTRGSPHSTVCPTRGTRLCRRQIL